MEATRKQIIQDAERLYWNVIKGIAIFLMIYGHCIQYCALDSFDFFENGIFKLIYSFHMPLFMIVSGYLYFFSFQKRSLSELLNHRTKSMLHPIVFATILNNLIMLLPNTILSRELRIFDGALFEGIAYSLWFLWSVLTASLTVGLICKTTKNWLLQILFSCFGFLLVALFPNWDRNLYMYPFFLVGFFYAMHRERIGKIVSKLIWISLILFPLLLCFYRREHYIYITPIYSSENGLLYSLKIDLFRYLIGLAGSCCVLALVGFAFKRFPVRGQTPKLLAAVAKLGENSLQIYCLSVSLLSGYLPIAYRKVMEPFGRNLLAENWTVYNLIFTPLLSVLYCIGLYYAVRLLRKIKIHSLVFGR